MTAEDRACAVQLLRSAAADHLAHLDPAERDELVERISAAIERCARKRAAEELRAIGRSGLAASPGPHPVRVPVSFLFDRAEALDHHEEAL
jgi:hypothetical protein